jgi:mevalonate kinase
MKVTASAPGKLVLFGDHAAVYGRPCLVTAVDLRFYATAKRTSESLIEINTAELEAKGIQRRFMLADATEALRETAFVESAVRRFFKHFPFEDGLYLTTRGPKMSYGLGSSSAITVATIGALAHLYGITMSLDEVFQMSYAAVLDVQGEGSGVDVAAAVFGGTVYYVKGGATLEPLAFTDLPIVMGYSGSKVSTLNYIAQVKDLYARQPTLVTQIFDMMETIVEQAKTQCVAGDWQSVGELANFHQGLLDALGVTTPQLFNPIYAARDNGAYGAKLSGAGGGDCMFAVVNETTRTQVEAAIQQAGANVVQIAPNAAGVRVEAT